MDWFHRKERTKSMLDKISTMNDFFIDLDKEGVRGSLYCKNEERTKQHQKNDH